MLTLNPHVLELPVLKIQSSGYSSVVAYLSINPQYSEGGNLYLLLGLIFVIPAFRLWTLEDCYKFEVSLAYIARFCFLKRVGGGNQSILFKKLESLY